MVMGMDFSSVHEVFQRGVAWTSDLRAGFLGLLGMVLIMVYDGRLE